MFRRRKPASTKRVLRVHRDWRQGERRFYCRAGDESGVIVMEDGGSRVGTTYLNPVLVFSVSHDCLKRMGGRGKLGLL